MKEENFDYQHEYQQERDAKWYAPFRNLFWKIVALPIVVIGNVLDSRNKTNKLGKNC